MASPADDEATISTGEVSEHLACREDPARSYALYLPSAFRPDRRWPVLILMDPRGRALVPLELFRPVAEDLGYVLVSSYDTASDGPRAPNILALRALLPEIEARFSPAPGRIYFAGFSGTARFAWDAGALMGNKVAGLIGVGAGLPPAYDPPSPATFAFFGIAGNSDFNYEELRVLHRALDEGSQAHRFATFPGPHSWPPAPVCTAALEWMELQAIKTGLLPRSDSLLERLHGAALNRARALHGNPLLAAEAWTAIAEDFAGLQDVTAAAAKAAQLSAGEDVQKARRRERELILARDRYQEKFSAWLRQVDTGRNPPVTARSLRTLEIARLQRRRDGNDPMDAEAAGRILAHVFSYTAFYEPRRYLGENRPLPALAMLAVADAIQPDGPQVCLGRARAYAMSGQRQKGLQALACLSRSGGVSAAFVAGDPGLAPLRRGEDYEALMSRWPAPSP
jgi:predicted esterase